MKKVILSLIVLLLVNGALAATEAQDLPPGVPVIAMTHPTRFQVMNIVEMFEKNIIQLDSMVLLGIYHEDELANGEEARAYEEAAAYVRENSITYVRFRKVTGRVAPMDLFRENAWTAQFKDIFAVASGIIFTGGMDIPPMIYNRKIGLLTEPTTPARHLYEVSLLFHLLGSSRNRAFAPWLASRRDFPVLAICLGLQSLNVAVGGTLIQDIPSEVYGQKTVQEVLAAGPDGVHSGVYLEKLYPNDSQLAPPFHRIRLGKESIFVRRMGFSWDDLPVVATAHHQAIGNLGAGLRVTATSLDGKIIEAAEHDRFVNVLGIQFHPERHTLYRKGLFLHPRPDAPLDFNSRAFLKANPPSYEFHLAIWKWFGEQVSAQK